MNNNNPSRPINAQIITSVFDREKDGKLKLTGLPDYATYSPEGMDADAEIINLATVFDSIYTKLDPAISRYKIELKSEQIQETQKETTNIIKKYIDKYSKDYYTNEELTKQTVTAFKAADPVQISKSIENAKKFRLLCANERFRDNITKLRFLESVTATEPGQLDYEYAVFDHYVEEEIVSQLKQRVDNIVKKNAGKKSPIQITLQGTGTDPNNHLNGVGDEVLKGSVIKSLTSPEVINEINKYIATEYPNSEISLSSHFTCGSEQSYLFLTKEHPLSSTKGWEKQKVQPDFMGRKSIEYSTEEMKKLTSQGDNTKIIKEHLGDISNPVIHGKTEPHMLAIQIDEKTKIEVPANCEHGQVILTKDGANQLPFEAYPERDEEHKNNTSFAYNLGTKGQSRLYQTAVNHKNMVHLGFYVYNVGGKIFTTFLTQHHFNGGGMGSQKVNQYIENSLHEFQKQLEFHLTNMPKDAFKADGELIASEVKDDEAFQNMFSLLKAKLAKAHYMALQSVKGFEGFYKTTKTKAAIKSIEEKIAFYGNKVLCIPQNHVQQKSATTTSPTSPKDIKDMQGRIANWKKGSTYTSLYKTENNSFKKMDFEVAAETTHKPKVVKAEPKIEGKVTKPIIREDSNLKAKYNNNFKSNISPQVIEVKLERDGKITKPVTKPLSPNNLNFSFARVGFNPQTKANHDNIKPKLRVPEAPQVINVKLDRGGTVKPFRDTQLNSDIQTKTGLHPTKPSTIKTRQ